MTKNYNHTIAVNLKTLREKRNLSLEKAAKITGVSKSMIARLERGDVNPTVSLMLKLADGFQVTFTELLYEKKRDSTVIKKSDTNPQESDYGRFRDYPVLPYNSERRFEVHMVEIDPAGSYEANPHSDGSEEFLTVAKGNVSITVGNMSHKLSAGDSILFKADLGHSYKNPGKKTCRLNIIIHYPAI